MTTRRALSCRPGVALLAAALLAALGTILLVRAPHDAPHVAARSTPAQTDSAVPLPRASRPASDRPPAVKQGKPPDPAVDTVSPVPPAGDGPGADAAIQCVLEHSSPADLPRSVERDAVALAEQVWRADVTGAGRVRWPRYFSATAPARHLYTRVRIQAGIARRTDAGRVVVHLVWAGADPSGQYREGRTARVLLARTDHGWEPVR